MSLCNLSIISLLSLQVLKLKLWTNKWVPGMHQCTILRIKSSKSRLCPLPLPREALRSTCTFHNVRDKRGYHEKPSLLCRGRQRDCTIFSVKRTVFRRKNYSRPSWSSREEIKTNRDRSAAGVSETSKQAALRHALREQAMHMHRALIVPSNATLWMCPLEGMFGDRRRPRCFRNCFLYWDSFESDRLD